MYANSKNSEAKDKVPVNRKKMFKMGNKKGICSVVELRMRDHNYGALMA